MQSGIKLGSTRGLDESQQKAVREALQQDVTYLWGPPGTGKTHTLANLIASVALGGRRVVATAIANVAVDQLAARLVRALEAEGPRGAGLLEAGRILRFGHARLPEVTSERRLFPNKEETQRLRRSLHEAREQHRRIPDNKPQERALSQKAINDLSRALRDVTKRTIEAAAVVLTTSVQVCLESTFANTLFDMTVVDEASMMPVPYAAAMGMSATTHFVLAGDFRQLGPIAVARTQSAYEWLHKDVFSLVGIGHELSHPSLKMLTVQRRMHPQICDLINRPFYDGKLQTQVDPARISPCELPPLRGKAAVLVELLAQDGASVVQTAGHSRVNEKSAEVVARLAALLAGRHERIEIAAIAPYRAQVSEIKRRLRTVGLRPDALRRIRVGTVHAFQGSESDMVIWDLVDTRDFRIGKLYQGDAGNRLTNVAISRAKGKLVVVGDPDAFVHAPGYESVGLVKAILVNAFNDAANRVAAKDALLECAR